MVDINIFTLYNNAKTVLMLAGIPNYSNEAGFLIEKISGLKKHELAIKSNLPVHESQVSELESYIKRRKNGEPLQYILGEWEFYGLDFYVGDGVLIPRADTETLVDTAFSLLKENDGPVICDLCSGSGCIAIALEKKLGSAKIYAVEKSKDALAFLEKNISLHNSAVKIIRGDVLENSISDNIPVVDAIVCNPPYLTKKDMDNLQKEVTFEPDMALKGGDDGLYFYRGITKLWREKIKPGGFLAYEIGMGQENDVEKIMLENGFKDIFFTKDLCEITRVVTGAK